MELTRKCPGCNWEYPLTYISSKCRFCKTIFNTQLCRSCSTWLPKEHFNYQAGVPRTECKDCGRERKKAYDKTHSLKRYEKDRAFRVRRRDEAERRYTEWVSKSAPLHFKPLQESDWLDTCRHFGGCAFCGYEHIETRQYFVLFEDGGMYTKWNVFPLCSKCSIRARFQVNPFIWLDKYLGIVTEWGLNEDRIERLISYLELQIEKAGKSNEQQTFSSIQRLHD